MSVITISSRELNQDLGRAKKAASTAPVIITDRGKPAHVLLSFETYQNLTKQHRNILDSLALVEASEQKIEFDFNPEKVVISANPAEFS